MKGLYIFIIFAVSLPFTSFAQQPECDYKVEVLVDGQEFESNDFTWRMQAAKIEGKSTNITGKAKIEDSGGKVVKSYKPWVSDSISKQKTSNKYTPNLKPGEYEIMAEINVECDDINKDNNVDAKKIKIQGVVEETKNQKSSENTEKSNKLKNTEANNIESNKIESQTSQNTIATKSEKAASKKPDAEEIDNVIQLAASNDKKSKQPQITAHATQQSPIVYESSNEKAKGLVMIFILTLSILLNIVLIWKR